MKIQTRFGGVVGFGFHAGIGLDPANMDVIPAGGIKFYPYKWIYINALIGYEIINSYLAYSALLAGVDMTFGKRFGFNAGLGVANYEGWIGPALDGGLIIRIIK